MREQAAAEVFRKKSISGVVLFIASRRDGFIANSDVTVDSHFHGADYGYAEFMASVDAVVIGRKTWEHATTFEDVPFAGKQIVVFSRSNSASTDDRIRFVHGDPAGCIAAMRTNILKDIWLVGGGDLIRQFIDR